MPLFKVVEGVHCHWLSLAPDRLHLIDSSALRHIDDVAAEGVLVDAIGDIDSLTKVHFIVVTNCGT